MNVRICITARRRLSLVLMTAALALVWGCLIIPVDYHAAGSRHNLNHKTPDALRAGVTTKEEVFLRLGEPDFASEDGQRLGYAWTKVKALWAVGGPYGGGASGEIQRSYVVEVSFDASNQLSRVRLLQGWGKGVKPSPALDSPP